MPQNTKNNLVVFQHHGLLITDVLLPSMQYCRDQMEFNTDFNTPARDSETLQLECIVAPAYKSWKFGQIHPPQNHLQRKELHLCVCNHVYTPDVKSVKHGTFQHPIDEVGCNNPYVLYCRYILPPCIQQHYNTLAVTMPFCLDDVAPCLPQNWGMCAHVSKISETAWCCIRNNTRLKTQDFLAFSLASTCQASRKCIAVWCFHRATTLILMNLVCICTRVFLHHCANTSHLVRFDQRETTLTDLERTWRICDTRNRNDSKATATPFLPILLTTWLQIRSAQNHFPSFWNFLSTFSLVNVYHRSKMSADAFFCLLVADQIRYLPFCMCSHACMHLPISEAN